MCDAIVDTVYAQLKMLIPAHVQSSFPIPVLLALSGGADSIGLLRVLHIIQERYGFCKVYAAHVEHNMQRTQDQAHENTVVKNICKVYDIPLFSTSIPYGTIQHEHEARKQRYKRILHIAYTKNICIIMTAHHQDDQYETILMRMVRGDGVRGLAGIPPIRKYIYHANDSPQERLAYYVIRPALQCKGNELKHIALQTKYDVHYDSSNNSTMPLRNSIRNTITPELYKIFPDVVSRISNIAAHQRIVLRDFGILDRSQASITTEKSTSPWSVSDEGLCIPRYSFERLSYTIRLRTLFMAANWLGLSRIHEKFFAPLLKHSLSTSITLYKSNTVITVDYKMITWKKQCSRGDSTALFLLPVQVGHENTINNRKRFDIQKNSYYVNDSVITVKETHTIIYNGETWQYCVYSAENNDEYTNGMRYTCAYIGALAWNEITKHSIINMGNICVNVRSVLDSPKWKSVPVLKDMVGIVLVPGEVFARRTLCADRKSTIQNNGHTPSFCTVVIGYHWVTVLFND